MKGFSSLKIGTKLIIGFLIVAIVAGVIGVYSIVLMKNQQEQNNSMFQNYGNSQGYLGYVLGNFQKQRAYLRDLQIDKDIEKAKSTQQKISESDAVMKENLALYEATCITDEEKAMYIDLEEKINTYITARDGIVDYAVNGQFDESYALLTAAASSQAVTDATDAIDNAVAENVTLANDTLTKQAADVSRQMIILIAVVAGAVVAALLLGVVLSRAISGPIIKMVASAKKLAAGDTNVDLAVTSNDEVGILAAAFSGMVASIKKLIADAEMLADAAVAGKLSARADATQHEGDYRKIVEGINNTLDSFTRPLDEAASLLQKVANGEDSHLVDLDLYAGDFKIIMNNMNNVNRSLYYLTEDTSMLAQSAVEGKLSVRADLSRHKGGYQKIIKGVNNTLDAVIDPITEATTVLKEMAMGNLNVNMQGDYKGDHAIIKTAMNETISSIKGYISEIANVLGDIAGGDLRASITSEFKGNFVQLKDSINSIIDSLNEVLAEINTAADQVTAGAQQVSNGNQAISQGATEQASSIEELSATVTEIAEQTRENAENSRKSNEMAMEAKLAAAQGNDQMKEMLKSMEDINESSENISKIIKVIDDIAFQTNMLALNAAVEAARAGVHGKGFAVVAEEVRNLAARSAKAAKETAELIEGSMKKVGAGTKIANDTAEALVRIVDGVDKTVELGEKIAMASNEQAAGINQVNQGIEQMSQVVQTNSATSQEGAAASEELSGQAELLREKISMFKLKKGTGETYKARGALKDAFIPAEELGFLNNGSKY